MGRTGHALREEATEALPRALRIPTISLDNGSDRRLLLLPPAGSRLRNPKVPRKANNQPENTTAQPGNNMDAASAAAGSNAAPAASTTLPEDPPGDLDSDAPELHEEDDEGESLWTQRPTDAASAAYWDSRLGAVEILDDRSTSSSPDALHYLGGVT